ncbi:hypothetical protein QUF80_00900 [Desulfococcaceae bacterium HSG8]|nr:hypothetical protein [Desulfococcaceae bacterium HSG8]
MMLSRRPVGKTTDSKIDLGDIVRDIDELWVDTILEHRILCFQVVNI